MVRKDGDIDHLVMLVSHFWKSTNSNELASAQELAFPASIQVFPILVVDVEQDSLNDPGGTRFEILEVVDVLISTTGTIAGISHLQKSIHEALAGSLRNVSRVDEQLHLECVAEQSRPVAVVVEIDVTHYLFVDKDWVNSRLFAL